MPQSMNLGGLNAFYRCGPPHQTMPVQRPLSTIFIKTIKFIINPKLQRIFNKTQEIFAQRKIPTNITFAFHGTKNGKIITLGLGVLLDENLIFPFFFSKRR